MKTESNQRLTPRANSITHGDCIEVMRGWQDASVDFILTDPPYLARYQDRSGRTVANDNCDSWLEPAFAQMYRLLRPNSFCVSFYGWHVADRFFTAWRNAGFSIAGHMVFCKPYASSTRFLHRNHEQAYLLAKTGGKPVANPISDVLGWSYTGNRLHPTQKPVGVLKQIVQTFTEPGALVLDPFCGSGSTLVAATTLGRRYAGIELDDAHIRTTQRRMASPPA